MTTKHIQSETPVLAIIYCRVSSAKQKIEGSGLQSQEHRCRMYAETHGYHVEAVFPDDFTGGGDFMARPGMVALLSYIDAQPTKNYVVIFDDLKRFTRDTEFHKKLRRAFQDRGARIECLNFKFDDSPEGMFVETIVVATGELERQQNKRQSFQKTKARLEMGYWASKQPVGYKFKKCRVHRLLLVRDEPEASILEEALNGFANGRFRSQAEVKRFLESHAGFPKDLPNGKIRATKVTRLLRNPVYAGCIKSAGYDVSLRKGQHEPLISFETFSRNQEFLDVKKRPAARKDIHKDFPLRNYVLCDDCGKPVTSCWSQGKNKKISILSV
ncbi:recombinase family protein [Leisingera aquimarina]|uniref:recombinase family protein n=1 Tax=Leisingera aquimarina TaxID=476529 RepID=UPI00146FB6F3|nr:recombinase family protein [Leisingera aquimarina]